MNGDSLEKVNPHNMDAATTLWGTGDLAVFLGGSDDSWTGMFLRLLAKSDPEHFARLKRAFPLHCRAFTAWRALTEPTVGNLTAALLG